MVITGAALVGGGGKFDIDTVVGLDDERSVSFVEGGMVEVRIGDLRAVAFHIGAAEYAAVGPASRGETWLGSVDLCRSPHPRERKQDGSQSRRELGKPVDIRDDDVEDREDRFSGRVLTSVLVHFMEELGIERSSAYLE